MHEFQSVQEKNITYYSMLPCAEYFPVKPDLRLQFFIRSK